MIDEHDLDGNNSLSPEFEIRVRKNMGSSDQIFLGNDGGQSSIDRYALHEKLERAFSAISANQQGYLSNEEQETNAMIALENALDIFKSLTGWCVVRRDAWKLIEHDLINAQEAVVEKVVIAPELKKALIAIAEGYPVTVHNDRYILVENERFAPDNGEDPKLLIDTWTFK